jgi:acetylglutamate kinase
MLINKYAGGHIRAVGLTGKDGGLIKAKKLDIEKYFKEIGEFIPTELLDLGHVGQVEFVDTQILKHLEEDYYIPVIAPVGFDNQGNAYNINADFVAAAVAGALKAEKAIFLTDIEGLKDKNGNIISSISREDAKKLIEDGTITGGMIPKMKACINALDEGVKKAHILDGRLPHAVLLEIFTSEGVGTEIY